MKYLIALPVLLWLGLMPPALIAQALPPNTKVLRDIEYIPGGGHSRSLDLYLPEKKGNAKLPLVVWIHGGAWLGGDKGANQALGLVQDGFATASINYRLSGEARFPAQIEDCKAAIRFLRSKAAEYGIDGERIGVWGSSAGGHLASLLGTSSTVKDGDAGGKNGPSSRVEAVCDFFGPADLLTLSSQAGNNAALNHDDPNSPEAQLIGGPIQQNADKARAASPISYITKDAPPFLIVHGDKDSVVPVGQSWELDGALRQAGASSSLHIVSGGTHGDNFVTKEIAPLVKEFFEKTLKR